MNRLARLAAAAARRLAAALGTVLVVGALDLALFRLPLRPLAHGDLGRSAASGRGVASLLRDAALHTAPLAAAALIAAAAVAAWLAAAATALPEQRGAARVTRLLCATPAAALGLVLAGLLGTSLGLFPVGPLAEPGSGSSLARAALPCAALALALGGAAALPLAAALRAARESAVAASARAAGVPPHAIRRRLVPRLGAAAALRAVPGATGATLAAILAVEAIADRPGLGSVAASALASGDRPVLQGLFLLVAAAAIAGRLALHGVAAALPPRGAG